MLNCDQTFDCLTDPIHRHSHEVEQHLDSCPRCRDMADALEPALDLLDESVGFESFDQPFPSSEYGLEQQPRVERAQAGSAARPWISPRSRKARVRDEGLTVAVFLVLVSTLAAALVNIGHDERAAVSIQLPPDCQRTEETQAEADNVIAGCVACHLDVESLAEMKPVQRQHSQALVQKCVTCHLDIAAYLSDENVTVAENSPPATGRLLASCLFGRSGG